MWREKRQNPPSEDDGLTPEKKAKFIKDYLHDGKIEITDQERAFLQDFLDHPEEFMPTARAINVAYEQCFPPQPGKQAELSDLANIRNVRVTVDYRYVNLLRREGSVCEISVEVRQNGPWTRRTFGFTAFDLPDWVKRRPQETHALA